MQPLFSVIIPCYNQAIYLSDCLHSLLDQTFRDWEAIVINDGSTDNTTEIANQFCNQDQRIKLSEKINGGLSSARNHGIQLSKGKRIIFLDADDFLYTNCLQEINTALLVATDIHLVQFGYTYISEHKDKILHTTLPIKYKDFRLKVISGVPGPCHTFCISKDMVDKIGFFDENLKSLEDWDYWLRAVKVGALQLIIEKPLAYYRYVRNSMSRNAFVMYDSFKKVGTRAPKHDVRILIDSTFNQDVAYDMKPIFQEFLIRILGVSIMQGKVNESIEIFQTETTKPINTFKATEFESMCSYLSFRYWYNEEEIKFVFTSIYPHFVTFFKHIPINNQTRNKVLFTIFKRHLFYKNIFKYGKLLGSIYNLLLRWRYKQ